MSRTPATFKASDLVRAVNAVHAAGLEVVATEICKDGRIILNHRPVAGELVGRNKQLQDNDWDKYLDAHQKK